MLYFPYSRCELNLIYTLISLLSFCLHFPCRGKRTDCIAFKVTFATVLTRVLSSHIRDLPIVGRLVSYSLRKVVELHNTSKTAVSEGRQAHLNPTSTLRLSTASPLSPCEQLYQHTHKIGKITTEACMS